MVKIPGRPGASGLAVVLVAASIALVGPQAGAEPEGNPTAGSEGSSEGRGATGGAAATQQTTRLAKQAAAADTEAAAETEVAGLEMPTSYPYQPQLRVYPDNDPDASDSGNLIGHDDIAPVLMDLMRASNRLSTQVVGQSTQGRDLYLVTVTAPETVSETTQQTAWRETIKHDPEAAASDAALSSGYKTPIWISSNIHGNEWEGTDASMEYIEELVTAPWTQVSNLLRNNRLYFSVALNPDGRTLGTRATALSLDPNRDMITNTTPETTSYIKTAQAIQPMYAADFHGYTSVLQVEPCGPPHGENYEYDLFLPQAYAAALAVEEDVVSEDIPGNTYYNVATGQVVAENTGSDTAHIKIPYRDTPSGWDDYPPIFTAQYAAFYGASTSTVELPKTRPSGSTQSPENATINIAVAKKTMESMTDYFNANRGDFLTNQIEAFRRGVAGEPKAALTVDNVAEVEGPDQWKALWDVADDQDPVTLPRAYVVPVGDDQRSASDAAALVDQLLLHGIEVSTLDADTTVGEVTYPAGSYVVDMHQPMRGLANSLLDLGTDISSKVSSMYDISAWSYSYLWGATVDKVGLTSDDPIGATTPVTTTPSNGDIPGKPGYLSFDVAGVADYAALNALLEEEVAVSLLETGAAVVGPDAYDAAVEVSDEFGIDFDRAGAEEITALGDETTKGLTDLTVGYSGSQDDSLSLARLGFDDLVVVSASSIAADPAVLDGIDILWVGSAISTADATVLSALQGFVASGRSIVGRGTAAFNLQKTLGLVTGTAVSGWSSGNGIVDVDTPEGSFLEPYAQEASFVYPALTFTGLEETTSVAQTYGGTSSTLLAGHWRSTTATNGPDYFVGKPSVIAGTGESGARGVVFGTSVVFRTHPKGGLSQAARALFWAAPEGGGVAGPSSTSMVVDVTSPIAYPSDATLEAVVDSEEGTPTGSVLVYGAGEELVAEGELTEGVATLTLSGLMPGTSAFTVAYEPDPEVFDPAEVSGVEVEVTRAASKTGLAVKKVGNKRVRATVTLALAGLPSKGTVVITDKGKVVKRLSVSGGKKAVVLKLKRGTHRLRAKFRGTAVALPSASPVRKVRIR